LEKLRLLLTILVLCLSFGAAQATHYFVDPVNGNDSNVGTRASPIKTLYHGQQLAIAGDTVHALPGVYGGPGQVNYCSLPDASGDGYVCQSVSGTANAPITYVSDVQWGAKLICDHDLAFFFIEADYIVIKGFDMTCPGSASAFAFQVGQYGAHGHMSVLNNYIHDSGTLLCGQSAAIFTGDRGLSNPGGSIIDGNVIRHIGNNDGSFSACAVQHGIYGGNKGEITTNNIVSGVVGIAIHSFGGGVCNEVVSGNIVFDNSNGGILLENTSGSGHFDNCANSFTADYNTVTNNISYHNGWARNLSGGFYNGQHAGIAVNGDLMGTHNYIANNISFGNNPNSTQTQGDIAIMSPGVYSNLIKPPLNAVFRNYRSDTNWAPDPRYNFYNYQPPLAGSPAIDGGIQAVAAGSGMTQVTHDILGVLRPQGAAFDIGAFEHIGSCCHRPGFRP